MSSPLSVKISGIELLRTPLLNKGLAFSSKERRELSLSAHLPPQIRTLEQQVEIAYKNIMDKSLSSFEKHKRLRALQDTNETVFYALLKKNISKIMPLIYTPTVGQACLEFSKNWTTPRGLFITAEDKGNIKNILSSKDYDSIKLIIVTDGERILGLGDLGANGMGIPIGKLSLYTACANIDPSVLLPITLDVGTENKELLSDPTYIGLHKKRLRGNAYQEFIEEFIDAIKNRWSYILLHWEDFANLNAASLLEKYQAVIPSFNDDIQGTSSIALATILAALKIKKEKLLQQKIVIMGSGSAGCGIASLLLKAMIAEGLDHQEALKRFYMVDRNGLLTNETKTLSKEQRNMISRHHILKEGASLEEVVTEIHPTILIGVSGQKGLFSENIIKTMSNHCQYPIIFPLSNPTHVAEATPHDILTWTNGRAIVSTGSPFDPVILNEKEYIIDQTNNSYIFPGLGLGILASSAKMVNDNMLLTAAKTVADLSPMTKGGKTLLPSINDIEDVSMKVAHAVAKCALDNGLSPLSEHDINENFKKLKWYAQYRSYEKEI